MDDSVGSSLVKEDDVGTASTGVKLDELVPGDGEFLSVGSLDGGGAGGEVLAGHLCASDHVSQQHRLELLLVIQQGVELVSRDLMKERYMSSLYSYC